MAWQGVPVSTWVTLTIAALAMGMMIFVIASGLTLVFGLMDVLNFGHGAFIAVGAYLAMTTLIPLGELDRRSNSLPLNLLALALAMLVAMLGTGVLGLAFERVIIMPVYGQHLKQILITTGGLIVAEQLIHVVWGGDQKPMTLPTALRGAIIIGDIALEKFRLLAVAIGLIIFLGMLVLLNRSKLGLLIRAGVENGEMVEALGYRIRRLFALVFVAGSALAGLGGTHVGALPRDADGRDRQRSDRAGVHRHHHRRLGFGRRLLPRCHPGGANGQLHRLSRP